MLLRRQRDIRAKAAEARAEAEAETPALEDMTGAQLKAALKDAGLPVSGKIDDLRARLADHQGNVQPATDDAGEETAGKGLDEVVDDVADAEAETSGGEQPEAADAETEAIESDADAMAAIDEAEAEDA